MFPEIGPVHSIIQDHYGYLWFGTEYNLVQYDGIDITVFQAEES
jgi:ligand-binding sensor domain-containing protein